MRAAVMVLCGAVLLGGCTTVDPPPEPEPSPAPSTAAPSTFVPTPPPDGLDPSRKAQAEAALPPAAPGVALWRGMERTSGAVHQDDAATGQLALEMACVGNGEPVRLVVRAGKTSRAVTVTCGPLRKRTVLEITATKPGVYAEASGPPQARGVMVWQLVRA